ncbi:radical SAM family heme chaperone HemW [Paenibacillus sp. KN14-4R]|uniref:radical SAM family heme chaperone HemW n=1 Tax=Paenibacillus sp. KN14-4R TaxID=3445773 RepID=UPI003F9F4BC3
MNVRLAAPKAVYIHIPFCTNKCFYCDFNSFVLQGQPVDAYLDALEREMERTVAVVPPEEVKTIFVGGGTPTVLTPPQMEKFLRMVGQYFPLNHPELEFSMEANPGTTDKDKLTVMRAGGVNRLSFGVQSFDNGLLERIGRIHNTDDVYRSIENAKDVGFDNISIDLMFGLPKQTVDIMNSTLDAALKLDLQHYSIYSLKVEENTLFHTLFNKNQLPLPDEDEELDMYELIMRRLKEAGYEQYEISNFARPGRKSMHNITYWLNHPYYGLGAGAHGYVRGMRHVNIKGVQPYINAAMEGLPILEKNEVSEKEAMEDFMMVGLRLLSGVRSVDFEAQFGVKLHDVFGSKLDKLVAQELLIQREDGVYCLTDRGLLLGNEVFGEFLE